MSFTVRERAHKSAVPVSGRAHASSHVPRANKHPRVSAGRRGNGAE